MNKFEEARKRLRILIPHKYVATKKIMYEIAADYIEYLVKELNAHKAANKEYLEDWIERKTLTGPDQQSPSQTS